MKQDNWFDHTQGVFLKKTKRKEFESQGKVNTTNRAETVETEDVKLVYKKQTFGAGMFLIIL